MHRLLVIHGILLIRIPSVLRLLDAIVARPLLSEAVRRTSLAVTMEMDTKHNECDDPENPIVLSVQLQSPREVEAHQFSAPMPAAAAMALRNE